MPCSFLVNMVIRLKVFCHIAVKESCFYQALLSSASGESIEDHELLNVLTKRTTSTI